MTLRPFSSRARGVFISVDGPSGAGKSTIVRHLAQMLVAAGEHVHITAEPSEGPIGTLCRELTETTTGYALACSCGNSMPTSNDPTWRSSSMPTPTSLPDACWNAGRTTASNSPLAAATPKRTSTARPPNGSSKPASMSYAWSATSDHQNSPPPSFMTD